MNHDIIAQQLVKNAAVIKEEILYFAISSDMLCGNKGQAAHVLEHF